MRPSDRQGAVTGKVSRSLLVMDRYRYQYRACFYRKPGNRLVSGLYSDRPYRQYCRPVVRFGRNVPGPLYKSNDRLDPVQFVSGRIDGRKDGQGVEPAHRNISGDFKKGVGRGPLAKQRTDIFYDDAAVDACLRLFREKAFKLAEA